MVMATFTRAEVYQGLLAKWLAASSRGRLARATPSSPSLSDDVARASLLPGVRALTPLLHLFELPDDLVNRHVHLAFLQS